MTSFHYACPHCSKKNIIQKSNVGHIVRCLHCKQRVAWEGETPVCGPADPESPPKIKPNWSLVRSGAIALVIAVPPLLFGGWQIIDAYQSSSWPSVHGIVLSSGIVSGPDNHAGPRGNVHIDDTAAAKVRYSYELSGVTYEGDNVRIGQVFFSKTFGRAEATAKRHPRGPAEIYYDPEDPRRSVLEPGLNADVFLMPGVCLVFVILGAVFVAKGMRPSPAVLG